MTVSSEGCSQGGHDYLLPHATAQPCTKQKTSSSIDDEFNLSFKLVSEFKEHSSVGQWVMGDVRPLTLLLIFRFSAEV